MPSIQASIHAHNKKILGEGSQLTRGACNCREDPDGCPMPGECTTPNLLYEGNITSDLPNYGEKIYKGISEPPFKNRFGNHKKSFNNIKYKTETCLSKEVWNIKGLGGTYHITLDSASQQENVGSAEVKSSKSLNTEEPICSNNVSFL